MRHRSGPIYYWYEELSTRYLTGALHVDDVVVDDYGELFVKLRGLAAVRNLYGTRIVALGGPWGKYAPEAPDVARSRYRLDIVDLAYGDFARRVASAKADPQLMRSAAGCARRYLRLPPHGAAHRRAVR